MHSQRVGQDIQILLILLQVPSGDNMYRYSAYIVMVCKFTIWKSWKYHTNSHTSEPGCSRKCMYYYNQIFHSCNAIAVTKYTTTKYFRQRWVWSIIRGYRKFHDQILLTCWVKHASGERKKMKLKLNTQVSINQVCDTIRTHTPCTIKYLVMLMWGCWKYHFQTPIISDVYSSFFSQNTQV